jgi:uncharacterized protein YllA (UPF0747 family)
LSNQWDFEKIISEMKKDIKAAFGSSMSQEIDTVITNMSKLLQENFRDLKSRLDELEQNIIRAIERKENLEIARLN